MITNEAATITSRNEVAEPSSDNGASAAHVLAAVWCRSVGTSWTLELHELGGGTAPGKIMDWISSGVPIGQPGARGAGQCAARRTRAAAVPGFVRWPLYAQSAGHRLRVPRR